MPAPLMVNEATACAILSVSPRTLYDWRKSGLVAYIRVGKSGIRYAMTDLAALVESQRRREGAAP